MEETALTFRNSLWLFALILVPVFIALAVRSEWLSRRTLENFLGNRMAQRLAASVSWPLRRWRTGLLAAGLVLAIFALAGPQIGYETTDREVSGIDVILAMDTSKSMLASDIQPQRLLRAKLSALDVVKGLKGDRVGLIAFAGGAFLQAPMTIDHGVVRETIQDLDSSIIPTGGTNIEDALDLAVEAFGKGESGSRALVIYSDGEEWTADAARLAEQARENNIALYTVGVGTETGAPILLQDRFGRTMYHLDNQGQRVITRLDESFLRELAERANGQYYHLGDQTNVAEALLTEFDSLTRRTSDVTLTEPLDRYQWPLALGIALLALAFTITGRRRTPEERRTEPVPVPPTRTPAREEAASRAPAGSVAPLLLAALFLGFTPSDLRAEDDPLLAARDLEGAGKYLEAYAEYMNFLEANRDSAFPYEDRVQYNAGRAAYRARQYDAAIDAFSQSLLSENPELQASSQYNLGNALFRKGQELEQKDLEAAIKAMESALSHYEDTLKIDPNFEKAEHNRKVAQEEWKRMKVDDPPPPPGTDSREPQDEQEQKDQEQQDEQEGQPQDKEQEGEQPSEEEGDQQQEEGQEQQQESGEQPEQEGQPDDAPGDQQQEDRQDPGQEQPRDPQQQSDQPQDQEGEQGEGDPQEESEGQKGEEKEQQGQQGEQQEEEQEEPSPGAGEDELQDDQQAEEGTEDKENAPSVDGQPEEERPEQAGARDFELQDDQPAEDGQSDAGAGQQQMAAVPVQPEEMSEEQARALLESLESEEQRVPLLETRRARRSNMRDW